MPEKTYAQAAIDTILEQMRKDPHVFVMGEDLHAVTYVAALAEFGTERIRNTPISECGFVGAGIGAALTGMRPVVEASVATFLYSAMDQIASQAAKSRYMFGGQANIPIVIRSACYYGTSSAAHHSDRPWGLFAQIPGLKIVVPSCAYDVKGLLTAAIRDDNPVLWFDDATLFSATGNVPDEDYTIPLGVADIKRSGADITVVSLAASVNHALDAAATLANEGISIEVVDLRTVVPMDQQTILQSVAKTGRLIVVDAAPKTCSVAAEVAALVFENAFDCLKAPVIRLTAPDVPVPFSPHLEHLVYPTAEGIVTAARRLTECRPARQRALMLAGMQ